MKNGACHLKEHPKISRFTKFDGYWFKPKGMVHLVWIGGTGVLQSILSSLILKVYHTFAFKPITIKFGEFTNFWMLFQMTCPIFNLIDIEFSYQEKICSYPVPCSFRTWPIEVDLRCKPKYFSLQRDFMWPSRKQLAKNVYSTTKTTARIYWL